MIRFQKLSMNCNAACNQVYIVVVRTKSCKMQSQKSAIKDVKDLHLIFKSKNLHDNNLMK